MRLCFILSRRIEIVSFKTWFLSLLSLLQPGSYHLAHTFRPIKLHEVVTHNVSQVGASHMFTRWSVSQLHTSLCSCYRLSLLLSSFIAHQIQQINKRLSSDPQGCFEPFFVTRRPNGFPPAVISRVTFDTSIDIKPITFCHANDER